ncbi:MAG: hypothetical protein ACKV2Q_01020 [Planctomycetaceae bacterium]
MATDEWPKVVSGTVAGTNETWARIQDALLTGTRGLPGGSSLARLLAEHRGVRNLQELPLLTVEQILSWGDAHNAVTGEWPNQKSGKVTGTDETWSGISNALRGTGRGLSGGSSLAKLFAEYRGVRNFKSPPPLTVEQILIWADAQMVATGEWPKSNSGKVTGTEETWAGINYSLTTGRRGLPASSSLAKLLAEYRGVRNCMDLPPLTVAQILAWADMHKAATGDWPNRNSGQVTGTDESWGAIHSAIKQGLRGLPRGSSLAKLLQQ